MSANLPPAYAIKRHAARSGIALRVATLLGIAYYFLRKLRRRLRILKLPHAKCLHWHAFLGDFGHIIFGSRTVLHTNGRPDFMAIFQEAAEETRTQGFFVVSLLHWLNPLSRELVMVHDFKLVKKILARESWAVYQKGDAYKIAGDLIGHRGLLASPDNDLWHAQRRVSSAAFKRSILESALIPNVHELVNAMCLRWEAAAVAAGGERPVLRFEKEATNLTIGILGRLAFGFDFDGGGAMATELGQGPLADAFACVLLHMANFGENPVLFLLRWIPTAWNRAYWRAMRTIDTSVKAALESRLAESKTGEDLLGQLLKATRDEGSPLDRELLVENLKTFLFAGHDTTASTLSWLLYLVSTHPEVEARLLEELAPLGAELPSCQALEALPFLDAVLRETLRLYPPAGFTREPLSDVNLGGYDVPRGSQIFIFPYLVHRNESLFPDAERFEPARWLAPLDKDGESPQEGGLSKVPSESASNAGWLPFSLGLRNCVGMHVARLELKAALHALLTRYHFDVASAPRGPPQVVLHMTLVPNVVPLIPRRRTET